MTVQQLAAELSAAFEAAIHQRTESKYVRLRDDSPKWMTDVVRECHDDGRILPDDFRYRVIAEAASVIAEVEGDADDIRDESGTFADNVGDSAAWLSSLSGLREGYIAEAIRELGAVDYPLAAGQYLERQEIFDSLVTALEQRVEEEEEDE